MAPVFEHLSRSDFDLSFSYHAAAILHDDFPDAARELDSIIGSVEVPIEELARSGGGEAAVTQRLRRTLHAAGWRKTTFRVEKRINDATTFSQSH